MKKKIPVLFAVFALLVLSGCYEPSPLYGSWADNDGNKLTFISDGDFVARIKSEDGTTIIYQGSYTVLDNVISFSYSDDSGTSDTRNTEWDIRGSQLYLYWTVDGESKLLTLYHVSK